MRRLRLPRHRGRGCATTVLRARDLQVGMATTVYVVDDEERALGHWEVEDVMADVVKTHQAIEVHVFPRRPRRLPPDREVRVTW